MTESRSTALIAIDWGTTSARAYRLGANGSVRDTRSAPLGIASLRDGGFASALHTLLADWRDDDVPRIACGMIGSRQGWIEAPYVECPAELAVFGRALTATPGGELMIVPGARCIDAAGVPDVMRGEETQLVGAIRRDDAQVVAVLPGTHSKWAIVERGRLAEFASFMTGELYAVLLAHSILGRMAAERDGVAMAAEPGQMTKAAEPGQMTKAAEPGQMTKAAEPGQMTKAAEPGQMTKAAEPGRVAMEAFDRGVTRGYAGLGLAHAIFGARTLALAGELASEEVGDWLSGVLIGDEIRAASGWTKQHAVEAASVRVIGEGPLVSRYIRALEALGIGAEPGPVDAAAAGLYRIAQHAGLLAS